MSRAVVARFISPQVDHIKTQQAGSLTLVAAVNDGELRDDGE